MYKFIKIKEHVINLVTVNNIEIEDFECGETEASSGLDNYYELFIRTNSDVIILRYETKEDRDSDYQGILNIIKPQQI